MCPHRSDQDRPGSWCWCWPTVAVGPVTGCRQPLPPGTAEDFLELTIGEFAVGYCRLALQCLVLGALGRLLLGHFLQAGVDVDVQSAHKEAGHGSDMVHRFARRQPIFDPRRKTAFTAAYRSRLKINVTLMLMPSAINWRMAGRPALVAGTLIMRLRRSTAAWRPRPSAIVAAVSWARSELPPG